METMTPKHERWVEFYGYLSETINDHECRRGMQQTRGILKDWGFQPDEVEASLAGFADANALCDCEVLLKCAGPNGNVQLNFGPHHTKTWDYGLAEECRNNTELAATR